MYFLFEIMFFRNPVLNKSFDVLPQVKDDDTPSADQVSEDSVSEMVFFSIWENLWGIRLIIFLFFLIFVG